MLPPPEGVWGMPAGDAGDSCPASTRTSRRTADEAREIMQQAGYGPDNRLKLKLLTRDIPTYRDPAMILIDQLKEIFIDAELEIVDTAVWYQPGVPQGLPDRR